MATSILKKTVSLIVNPDSQNFDMSNAYIYISKMLDTYGVPNPSLVSGVVMQFEPIKKNEIQSEKNLIENLARVAEEINNNASNFLVGLDVSISQDSINSLSNSISDAITQFASIKEMVFEKPYVPPVEPQPEPQPKPQPQLPSQESPRIYRRGIPGFLMPTPNGGTEWVPEFGYGWNKYGVWAPKLTEDSFLYEDYGYGGEEVVVETKPRICTKDMFRCPDGSLVSRDENCNFRPCPQPQESYGYGGEEVVVSTPVVSKPIPTSIVLEINPKDASVSSSPRYFQMIVLKEQFPQIYSEWNKLPINKVGLNPNNTRNQIYTMDFSPDVASLVYIIQKMINESPFIPYTAEVAYL